SNAAADWKVRAPRLRISHDCKKNRCALVPRTEHRRGPKLSTVVEDTTAARLALITSVTEHLRRRCGRSIRRGPIKGGVSQEQFFELPIIIVLGKLRLLFAEQEDLALERVAPNALLGRQAGFSMIGD